jgi:hypothetical protein
MQKGKGDLSVCTQSGVGESTEKDHPDVQTEGLALGASERTQVGRQERRLGTSGDSDATAGGGGEISSLDSTRGQTSSRSENWTDSWTTTR